jgi:NADPH-dependent 2,4-dienoyl-CoA reductase/sulfur reductase-like enzyme
MIDLAIVGAGPAGIAAALQARQHGLSVTLLDENPAPGGRIWQALEARGAADKDEQRGLTLIRQLRDCGADIRFDASVWAIEPDGTVFHSDGDGARTVQARRVLLATGTQERALPIPGWTLPGVMTVGAAQIALKTGGLVPGQATWIAGQGPLVLLYAAQAVRAGGDIAGILDLSQASIMRAAPHLAVIPRVLPDLLKAVLWRRAIARKGVPWIKASDIRAEGDGVLQRISFQTAGGRRTEAARTLLLHDGIIPSVQMTRALGCAHVWNEAQQAWNPRVDAWGATSVPGIHVAGDAAGIGGALAAPYAGRIAALGIAHDLGRLDTAARDRMAALYRRFHARRLLIRPLLDALYPPLRLPIADDAIVCRCEAVTAGAIRATPARGLNQLKAYTRTGMGPCQGRYCAGTAARVLAEARGVAEHEIDPLRTRFPAKPLRLEELATLDQ